MKTSGAEAGLYRALSSVSSFDLREVEAYIAHGIEAAPIVGSVSDSDKTGG